MSIWPVPDSYSKEIPKDGAPGSFWEDRDEKFHCGIDIYAPEGSDVLAIERGTVFKIDEFTSPEDVPYWNPTKYIIIKTPHKIFFKYAEISDVFVEVGQEVNAGELLGKVGQVINEDKVTVDAPYYIMDLVNNGNLSMLHVELYKFPVLEIMPYFGGNFLGAKKPYSLLNPGLFLNGTRRR